MTSKRVGRRALALFWTGLALACGGSTGHENEPSPAASVDDASDVIPANSPEIATLSDEANDGRHPSIDADSGITDAADEARPKRQNASEHIIRSGTRSCTDSRECFGFSCERGPALKQTGGACFLACITDEDCDNIEDRCFDTGGFGSFCVRACRSPVNCAYGFECVDFYLDEHYACVPTPWLSVLPDR